MGQSETSKSAIDFVFFIHSNLILSKSSDSSKDSQESDSPSSSHVKSPITQILQAIFPDSWWGKDLSPVMIPIRSLEYAVQYLPLPISPSYQVNYKGNPLPLNSLQLAFCRSIASTLKTKGESALTSVLNELRNLGELPPIDDPSSLDFSEIPDTKLPHSNKALSFVLLNGSVYSIRVPIQQFKVNKAHFASVSRFLSFSLAGIHASRIGLAPRNAGFPCSMLLSARPQLGNDPIRPEGEMDRAHRDHGLVIAVQNRYCGS